MHRYRRAVIYQNCHLKTIKNVSFTPDGHPSSERRAELFRFNSMLGYNHFSLSPTCTMINVRFSAGGHLRGMDALGKRTLPWNNNCPNMKSQWQKVETVSYSHHDVTRWDEGCSGTGRPIEILLKCVDIRVLFIIVTVLPFEYFMFAQTAPYSSRMTSINDVKVTSEHDTDSGCADVSNSDDCGSSQGSNSSAEVCAANKESAG